DIEGVLVPGQAIDGRAQSLGDEGALATGIELPDACSRRRAAPRQSGFRDVECAVISDGQAGREGEAFGYQLERRPPGSGLTLGHRLHRCSPRLSASEPSTIQAITSVKGASKPADTLAAPDTATSRRGNDLLLGVHRHLAEVEHIECPIGGVKPDIDRVDEG